MTSGEGKQNTAPETESDLAKDVAHLYSWANVEGVQYRDFSRQRKVRHTQQPTDADIRKSEAVQAPEVSIESEAQEFESSIDLPPVKERVEVASPEPVAAVVAEPPIENAQPQETALPEIPVAPVFFEPVLPAPAEEGISSAVAIYSL